ncbi:MAG: zf-HC2 domain-containing protein, partial [Anaerolineaceae bacterium]|nr:zf-HC2 domain-containing protein [Anaerolineaceae bacterium]
MNARVNSKDWLLLSAYLDGQLTPGERAEIEKQLEHRQELQADLTSLRVMQSLLRAVPSKPVPRSFTLTTMEAREAQPRSAWLPALSFSSLGAALLLVVSFIWQLAPGAATPVMISAPKAAVELQAAYEMAAEETQPPMIIVWGVPAASPMDLGTGGGGSAEVSRAFLPSDDAPAPAPAIEMDTSQETLLQPEMAPPPLEVDEALPGDEIVIAEQPAPKAPPAPTAPEEEALPVIQSEHVVAPEV